MREKTFNMEMGNLVCRFGQEKVLLDMIEEVVLPSFLDSSLVRSYNKTKYFFHEVSLVDLTDGVIGVVGRYVKDTTLEREQIFEEGKGLVRDADSLRSSPSALFLLILNNHRLIYVKETKDAPPKESFRSSLLGFLRVKYRKFIDDEYTKCEEKRILDPDLKKITKKEIRIKIPKPSLELIPLTSEDSINEFVKKYDVLKTIEIALSDRNDEMDSDPFFEAFQKRKDSIGSIKSTVKHNNSKGLDKNEAITEITEATEQGNQSVKLIGTDKEGDSLRGNNEKFQIRKPIENLHKNPKKAATKLYSAFISLVEDEIVKLPESSKKAKRIIKSLFGKLF